MDSVLIRLQWLGGMVVRYPPLLLLLSRKLLGTTRQVPICLSYPTLTEKSRWCNVYVLPWGCA